MTQAAGVLQQIDQDVFQADYELLSMSYERLGVGRLLHRHALAGHYAQKGRPALDDHTVDKLVSELSCAPGYYETLPRKADSDAEKKLIAVFPQPPFPHWQQ